MQWRLVRPLMRCLVVRINFHTIIDKTNTNDPEISMYSVKGLFPHTPLLFCLAVHA